MKRETALAMAIALLINCLPLGSSAFAWADPLPEDPDGSSSQLSDYFESTNSEGRVYITDTTTSGIVKEFEDGKVCVSKSIAPTEIENEFDITLTVKSKSVVEEKTIYAPAAVVLVLDVSLSMSDSDVNQMKAACNDLIDSLHANSHGADRYVSVVTFAKNVNRSDWVNVTPDGFTSPMSSLSFTRAAGTNTKGGLLNAQYMLNNLPADVDYQAVVLMTDGNPAYSLHAEGSNITVGTDFSSFNRDGEPLINGQKWYNDDRFKATKGTGKGDLNIYAAYRAEEVADQLRASGIDVFAIGYGDGLADKIYDSSATDLTKRTDVQTGSQWLLNDIAKANDRYFAANSGNLSNIFSGITTTLNTLSAAQVWNVKDPMGEGIEIVETPDMASVSTSGDTINWDLTKMTPEISTEVDGSVTTTVYTYTMTYRIRLNTLTDGFDKETVYKTNKATTVEYCISEEGKDDVVGTADFNIPSVHGYQNPEGIQACISFGKVIGEGANIGDALAGAVFELRAVSHPEWFVTASSGMDGMVSFTDIPSGQDYILKEIKAPAGYAVSEQQYKVRVEYGVASMSTFEGIPVDQASLEIPDEFYKLTVRKEWNDNDNADGTRPGSVDVTLKDGSNVMGTGTLSAANGWSHTWGIGDDGLGGTLDADKLYTIEETPVAEGYKASCEKLADGSYLLTNSLKPKTIDISVEKTFDSPGYGNSNRYPSGVTFTLYADGEEVDSHTVSKGASGYNAEDLQFVFKDLPRYDGFGREIDYTVIESFKSNEQYWYPEITVGTADEDGNYTVSIHNVYFTGRHITVYKLWDDGSDADGLRPETLTVQLYRADNSSGKSSSLKDSYSLNDGNGWCHTFTGLDSNKFYRVVESALPSGYSLVGSADTYQSTGLSSYGYGRTVTIENRHVPSTVSVSVGKVWDDNGDQDGVRPSAVSVRLLADGSFVSGSAITLNEGNSWQHTYTDLPAKDGGSAIAYTVTESAVTGYSAAISGNMADGFIVTNTHETETTSFTAIKIWSDNDNQDGLRDSYTIQLYADGTATGAAVELSKDTLEYTWEDLPRYKAGVEIAYTVDETVVPAGYTHRVIGNTITNTHETETTSFTAIKIWSDNDNQDGLRDSYTIQLYADGTATGAAVELSKDTLEYTWEDLPRYKAGVEIAYTVDETVVPAGYAHSVSGNTITNTHETETTSVSGIKVWNDSNDQDGIRTESVVISLLADGVEKETKTVTAGALEDWSFSFADLPVNASGSAIEYTVTEAAVTGYTSKITGDAATGFVVTNTHETEKTSVSGKKVWADNGDQDGLRQDHVVITLLANGTEKETKTVTEGALGDWSFEFTDLDAKASGSAITYTVTEAAVTGYTSEITGDAATGFVVTNTHETSKTAISVTKQWSDCEDHYAERPASVNVSLLADGIPVSSAALSSANSWTVKFADLDVNTGGGPITYTVTESAAGANYTASISGDAAAGFVITNKYSYPVSYEYVSGTAGRELPEEISTSGGAFRIDDASRYLKGETAANRGITTGTSFSSIAGTWTLVSWESDPADAVMAGPQVHFTGVWEFAEKDKYGVKYNYKSGTDGWSLPTEIDTGSGTYRIYDTDTYYPGEPTVNKGTSTAPIGASFFATEGEWTLDSWKADPADGIMPVNGSVLYTGIWTFTEGRSYSAKYEYVSGTPGKPLPSAIDTGSGVYKINDTNRYYAGETAFNMGTSPAPLGACHTVTEGQWIMAGWSSDPADAVMSSDGVKFTGVWVFAEGRKHPVSYSYESGTAGKELPSAIKVDEGIYAIIDLDTYYEGQVAANKGTSSAPVGECYFVKEGLWKLTKWEASPADRVMTTSGVSFKGIWKFFEGEKFSYHLWYNGNGGSKAGVSLVGDSENVSGVYDTEYTIGVDANCFTRPGYTFVGWAEDPEGTSMYLQPNVSLTKDDNSKTLYAIWLPQQEDDDDDDDDPKPPKPPVGPVPEEPVTPGALDPVDPADPAGPEDPGSGEGGGSHEGGHGDGDEQGEESGQGSYIPRTGDGNAVIAYTALMVLSLIALKILRRRSLQRNR